MDGDETEEITPIDAIALLSLHSYNRWHNKVTQKCLCVLEDFVCDNYEEAQ